MKSGNRKEREIGNKREMVEWNRGVRGAGNRRGRNEMEKRCGKEVNRREIRERWGRKEE